MHGRETSITRLLSNEFSRIKGEARDLFITLDMIYICEIFGEINAIEFGAECR